MQVEEIRSLLLGFPEVTEETPFGPDVAVYKTGGKMFALTSWDPNPLKFNLKCDPTHAEELRDRYACVEPGFHMNKKHWNTVVYDGSVEDSLFREWVEHSFRCVVKSMPKKRQTELLEKWESGATIQQNTAETQSIRNSMRKGI